MEAMQQTIRLAVLQPGGIVCHDENKTSGQTLVIEDTIQRIELYRRNMTV